MRESRSALRSSFLCLLWHSARERPATKCAKREGLYGVSLSGILLEWRGEPPATTGSALRLAKQTPPPVPKTGYALRLGKRNQKRRVTTAIPRTARSGSPLLLPLVTAERASRRFLARLRFVRWRALFFGVPARRLWRSATSSYCREPGRRTRSERRRAKRRGEEGVGARSRDRLRRELLRRAPL